ncbi:hypothetical protein AB6A23_18995 [Paenibacillus tarimensis]
MDGFIHEKKRKYTDFANVESSRNDLMAEEFPEGPYGADLITESLGKSSIWREDQRPPNRFDYENRELHEGLERGYDGDGGEGNAAPELFNRE